MHERTLLFLCAVLLLPAATSMARADEKKAAQSPKMDEFWESLKALPSAMFSSNLDASAQAPEKDAGPPRSPTTVLGFLKNGTPITMADLDKVAALNDERLKNGLASRSGPEVDWREANLGMADLRKADLSWVNLSKALLARSNLTKASLVGANLSGANLYVANLSGANFGGADLSGAHLFSANLTEAELMSADLRGANLVGVKMGGAGLLHAKMNNATFELVPGTLPDVQYAASAYGLAEMRYDQSPTSLIELREAFRTAGLREQANEVHFAIMHTRRIQAGRFEKIMLLAVEIPCAYGLRPGRPLLILLSAILAFWIPYIFALRKRGAGGIWIIWPDDRTPKDDATEKDARLSPPWFRRIGVALYFSVVSAFNIGWEEINIGSWIARMQPKEFTLKATGWVRVVAGGQSLLGVYMVALSILSYFGHLFE